MQPMIPSLTLFSNIQCPVRVVARVIQHPPPSATGAAFSSLMTPPPLCPARPPYEGLLRRLSASLGVHFPSNTLGRSGDPSIELVQLAQLHACFGPYSLALWPLSYLGCASMQKNQMKMFQV